MIRSIRVRRSPRWALLAALWLTAPAFAAWDIADTGQPFDEVSVAVQEGSWMSVDVSPDGSTLVFDLLGDLFLLPAAGGEARLLRQGPAFDRNPHFSPDGTRIAFISDGGGHDNVWIVNIDGTGAREVSRETASYVGTPAWTAGGDHVMARRFSVEGRRTGLPFGNHLWLYHVAGGAGRKIVDAPNAVAEPTLSRDGRWLYYTEDSAPFSFSKPNPDGANFVIRRRDLATGESSSLVSGYAGAFAPQISPNGEWLAFVRRVATKDVLFVYDLKSGKQRPVFDGLSRDFKVHNMLSGFYPSFGWFPDSRHVAIWARGALLNVDMLSGASQKIPFSAEATHRITRAVRFAQSLSEATFAAKAIGWPTLSPDGTTLIFGATGQLWKKRLPHGRPQRLTAADEFAYGPTFSPDGRSILYVRWQDTSGSRLQQISVDGKKSRTVLAFDAIVSHPAFSKDGGRITFQVQKPNPYFGGYHRRPGIYWAASTGGEPHFVTAEGFEPMFSSSGERLYFNLALQGAEGVSVLRSVALDGSGAREHVRSPEGHHLRLSPDGRSIAFQENYGLYVAPYFEAGTAMVLSARSPTVEIARLTQHRGNHHQWSADGRQLHWVSGSDYYSASVPVPTQPAQVAAPVSLGLEIPRDIPDGIVAFKGARIVTMKGDEVIENGVLVVNRNRIVAVGPADSTGIPKEATIVETAGKTIMPGLVDVHAHLLLGQQPDEFTPQQFSRYYANLSYGVTTSMDPYAPTQLVFGLAEMVKAGRMVGPRIFSTGDALMGFAGDPLTDARITSFESAREHVLRQKEAGAITLKSYVQPGRIERQQLIKAARELGMLAMPEGEGQFDHDVTMVLDGYTTVEHNLPNDTLYDDVVQLFAASKTTFTPTLMVNQAELNGMQYFYQRERIWEMPKMRSFTPVARGYDRWNKPLWAHQRTISATDEVYDIGTRSVARSLARLNKAGAVINLGSHGEIDGIGAIWELWLINQGGMSNHDTLRVGTLNGARTLGLDREIGSLETGKLADLIVLDADPIADIKALDKVRYTMVNGRLYDASSMNEIGNYDRPRGRFYWEVDGHPDIDWNDSMIGDFNPGGGGALRD